MSDTQAEPADDDPHEATGNDSPISTWRLLVALMFALILAYIGFLLWRAAVPAEWEFSIEAETEVAEIRLRPKTRTQWQVDGAVICARGDLELGDQYRLDRGESPCGSRAWRAWKIPAPEQVLELDGDSAATLNLRPEGGLAMSLRTAEGDSLGTFSIVGVVEDIVLTDAINLIWTEVPAQSLTFPFSGTTTLGRAVGWSNVGMLRSGTVSVYTADESADKRTLVDETNLMLGDQIRLGDADAGESWPKGFARVLPEDDVMRVVAFGRADSLRIERYGESGYDLKPGRFRKLASDPAVAFFGSLVAAYMTLILGLQPFISDNNGASPGTDILRSFNRWIRREKRRQ
ncbi:MAG: hypothetical protein ACR2QX_08480 [Woeseiaceae bacterium]